MKSIARNWLPKLPVEVVIYLTFGLLLTLATYPAWRVIVFGVTIDDLLRLRCASLPWG